MKRLIGTMVLLLIVQVNGLPQAVKFQNYNLNNGLSSNKVFQTVEDENGFVWIATEQGVDRFDGSEFVHYELTHLQEIRNLGFISFYLAIDSTNKIWLMSNGGLLYYYSKENDEFVYFDKVASDKNARVYAEVFYIDHNNKFWIGSFDGAIVYNPEFRESRRAEGVTGNISSIIQDNNSNYYFGSKDGIFVLDQNEGFQYNLIDQSTSAAGLKGFKIHSLYKEEVKDRLWIGSESMGLCFYDIEHHTLTKAGAGDRYRHLPIRSIRKFDVEQIIVGTDGAGIFMWDTDKQEMLQAIDYKEDKSESLSSNAIYDIFTNKDGILFISTYRGGLNIYNPGKPKFQSLNHVFREQNSLANDIVFSILESPSGELVFGTDKGISFLNKKSKTWRHLFIQGDKSNTKSAVVRSLAFDTKNSLWAASFTYQLVRFDLSKGQYVQSADMPVEIKDSEIKRILRDDDGLLWMTGISSNLKSYDPVGKLVSDYPVREIQAIDNLSREQLVVGNRAGLTIVNKSYGTLKRFEDGDAGFSLNNKLITCIEVDDQKNIWAGTVDSGTYKINVEKNTIEQFGAQKGLSSDYVFSLISDDENNIWISTSFGISKITTEGQIQNYFKSDGLISTDFNRNSVFKDSGGLLYFGTNQGVIYFDPKKIRATESKKNLVLTDFYLNHKRIFPGEGSPLKTEFDKTQNIQLNYDQNSFSIGFSSIDFTHPEQGKFRLKLENFDNNWVDGILARSATYTNLNPGQYTFRLQLVNHQNKLLAPEKQIHLQIDKPFWKSPVAYILYVVIILGLISLLLYSNRLRIEARHSEDRLHFLINMAHEIKTPLTLIRAPLSDLIQNQKVEATVQEGINIALQNAEKLHRQMMQFLDFRRLNIRKNVLNIEAFDLVELINEKIFAFKVLADKKRITLSFNSGLHSFQVVSDQKIIDKIISNLISNAIKYTKNEGAVEIELEEGSKFWSVLVKDNGIGIPKKEQRKIFKLFYRTEDARSSSTTGSGVGLVLASDLAQTLGGKVILDSSSDNGSCFRLTIAKRKENERLITEGIGVQEKLQDDNGGPNGQQASSKIKVVVAEDDQDLREYIKGKLQEKYQVLTASNGHEALDKVREQLPDLVISDVMMPKMNGRQLCLNLKSNLETCHIPVILLTGLSSKEHVMQGLESGADDYITKPFDYELFSIKVENLLNTRSILKKKFLYHEETGEKVEFANELDDSFIADITELVESHISDTELSITDLCEAVAMSRTSFYHKLKSLMDISPSEFIRTVRLKKAKSMLLNNNLNISEVAYSTGFSDAKYFSTSFRKYFGKSPSAYASEAREKRL